MFAAALVSHEQLFASLKHTQKYSAVENALMKQWACNTCFFSHAMLFAQAMGPRKSPTGEPPAGWAGSSVHWQCNGNKFVQFKVSLKLDEYVIVAHKLIPKWHVSVFSVSSADVASRHRDHPPTGAATVRAPETG